ncbi:MAG TPA: homoserine dehydrogenase [Tepidisphaeraceae bacterium]|jgi:homoserine dehydrogenase|nr:homoserine dehydrogenase [Tepidisphaeraceae bacterium]
MSDSRSFGVTLLGCGIVGGGVTSILLNQHDLLQKRTGIDFRLQHVVVKDREAYPPDHEKLPMSTDAMAAIDDPKTNVVIELIGGTGVAYEFVKRALSAGKPVITANKALLATKGPELFAIARANNTCIAFEASAGGGIPIIDALQRGLVANRVDALLGIVNGTCNFILSQMTQKGWSYDQALKEAQAQGFAEANPHMDVSGKDTMQKLAILAGLAFNVRIEEADIHLEGIDTLNAADIKYADELGYTIKLLAIAERQKGDAISLRVHPTLVHKADQLAQVSGSFNAISFYGHALGHAVFYGRGAGRMPTASAVVADLIGVALGTTPAMFKSLNIFPDQCPKAVVLPFDQLQSRYYLRLTAKDQPGVLAQVTKVLGDQKISIASFVQHETPATDGSVPLVLTTHRAQEGAMQTAIKQINALAPITAPAISLRIVDQPKEFAAA